VNTFNRVVRQALWAFCLLVMLMFGQTVGAAVIHVDGVNGTDNPGGPTPGDSWATAFLYLQDALDVAVPGDEIWVVGSPTGVVYRPDEGDSVANNNRNTTFRLQENLAILGGFRGPQPGYAGESNRNQRNPEVNISRLSGDLANNDNPNNTATYLDNAYHVVTGTLVNNTASIDGFTISDGDNLHVAIGETVPLPNPNPGNLLSGQTGAGMLLLGGPNQEPANAVKPGVMRIRFERNRSVVGGGLCIAGAQTSNPLIANCRFTDNFALMDGGGLANDTSRDAGGNPTAGAARPRLVNCIFHRNKAQGVSVDDGDGGAVWSTAGGSPRLVNCVVFGNFADHGGAGGVHHDYGCNAQPSTPSGDIDVYNCIVRNNDGPELRGNNGVGNSNVQGLNGICATKSTNLDADPQFMDAANGNFRIDADSLSRNAGDNARINVFADEFDIDQDGDVLDLVPDLDRLLRILNSTVDQGAFENHASSTCCADINASGCINVEDLLLIIGGWSSAGLADISPACGGDGSVNTQDLLAVISGWGPCPGFSCFENDMPTTVSECMQVCGQQFPGDTAGYNACLSDCIEALCKAELIDCDE